MVDRQTGIQHGQDRQVGIQHIYERQAFSADIAKTGIKHGQDRQVRQVFSTLKKGRPLVQTRKKFSRTGIQLG